jgi:hypothetical protein
MKNIHRHVPSGCIMNPCNINICWFANLEWQCRMKMCLKNIIFEHTSYWPYLSALWDDFSTCYWCKLKLRRSIRPLLNLVWSQWIFQQASETLKASPLKCHLIPTSTTTKMLDYIKWWQHGRIAIAFHYDNNFFCMLIQFPTIQQS